MIVFVFVSNTLFVIVSFYDLINVISNVRFISHSLIHTVITRVDRCRKDEKVIFPEKNLWTNPNSHAKYF